MKVSEMLRGAESSRRHALMVIAGHTGKLYVSPHVRFRESTREIPEIYVDVKMFDIMDTIEQLGRTATYVHAYNNTDSDEMVVVFEDGWILVDD